MADAQGILAKAAFRKDRGLYGAGPAIEYPETPGGSTLAANHQIPFVSENVIEKIDRYADTSLVGAGRMTPAEVIARLCNGPMESHYRWRGLEGLIMCATGFEQPDTSPAQLGVTSAYAHLFEGDDILADQAWTTGERTAGFAAGDRKVRRGCIAFHKQPSSYEDMIWSSVMVNKLTISGDTKQIKVSYELIPYNYAFGDYNHANWSMRSGSYSMALPTQVVYKAGLTSAGAGALAEFGIDSWEFAIDNKLKGDEQTTSSAERIIQPMRNGMRETTLKLHVPRYDSTIATHMALMDLDSEMMASIEATGPQIAATGYYYFLGIYLPITKMFDPIWAPIEGPQRLVSGYSLEAGRLNGTTDPFAATKYHSIGLKKDSEFRIVINNEDSFNYLSTDW